MKVGNFDVTIHNFGFFRLDGGSMFGSVPRNLWAKRIEPDAENRIRLATNSLMLNDGKRRLLVDAGCGDKWGEKLRAIYAIEEINWNPALDFKPTDVVLTHLHFDHAGGISRIREGKLQLTYPEATIHVQRANLQNAQSPTVKERASYLQENYGPVLDANTVLADGKTAVCSGVFGHRVDGHTIGQQWIEVSGQQPLFFPTDLIPTSHHLPLAFHMGYDCCANTLLKEKDEFLKRAVDEKAIVVFQHDPKVAAATVKLDAKGNYAVDSIIAET